MRNLLYDIGGLSYDLFHLSTSLGLEEQLKRTWVARLQLQAASRVIDIGAGTGLSAKWALEHLRKGAVLDLVDQRVSMLRRAEHRLGPKAARREVSLRCVGQTAELGTTRGVYDAVILSYVLGMQEADASTALLTSALEMLKEDGKLLIIDMYADDRGNVLQRVYRRAVRQFASTFFNQKFTMPYLALARTRAVMSYRAYPDLQAFAMILGPRRPTQHQSPHARST